MSEHERYLRASVTRHYGWIKGAKELLHFIGSRPDLWPPNDGLVLAFKKEVRDHKASCQRAVDYKESELQAY